MPIFAQQDTKLNYEIDGDGFPILLIAPGGMHSTMDAWDATDCKPRQSLSDEFQMIAMDQRNAGQSFAPVSGSDGWATYTADQLSLLDHLGIERCHVIGMCIGGPYIFGLAKAAPERIASAVIYQPIGHDGTNRHLFIDMFNAWRDAIRADHPEATDQDWDAFRANMYSGEFLFNTSKDDARQCQTQILLMLGQDPYHPEPISRMLADLAPNARLIENWKGEHNDAALAEVRTFLRQHS